MAGRTLIRTMALALGAWLACATVAPAQDSVSGASGPPQSWFPVERLNPGLGPAPETLDRSTPMGAVESFLGAVRARHYGRAAHLLDLSRLPVETQAKTGPELARRLGAVIEDHVWIDWDRLPDRPDGVIEQGAKSDPLAGQRRRSIEFGELDLGDHDVPLRLARLKPAGQPPAWVFAPQTVGNVNALYLRYGPGWLRDLLPRQWKRQTWFSLQLWEFAGLPLVLGLAAGVFLLLRLVFHCLARCAPWHAASRAFAAACTPLALLAAAALLQYATATLVTFSAPITSVLTPTIIAMMVIAVTLALLRGIDALIDVVAERYVGKIGENDIDEQRHAYTSIYAARRIVLLLAVLAGLGVILTQLHVFSAIGVSLLASAGVMAVILGIAAQTVLGNILASLQIALAKPIRIGDSVLYEGNWAYVESIFYTFVRLRTWDDRRVVVPVQYFISKPFENWSMVEEKMTRVFLLTLDPRADVGELREAYLAIAREDEDVMSDEMLKVLVVDQNRDGLIVRFYATAKDVSTAWNMHCRLRENTLAWIRQNHPDWWPRQREIEEHRDGEAPPRLDAAE